MLSSTVYHGWPIALYCSDAAILGCLEKACAFAFQPFKMASLGHLGPPVFLQMVFWMRTLHEKGAHSLCSSI